MLSLATQDADNPDLRDRGFIYWRLLSTDPAAAKEVVLAEKPLISEETDLLEPTLLDELICHIASLASVYHKPPTAFVEGSIGLKKALPSRGEDGAQAQVIPEPGSLIGDLLSMDLGGSAIGGAVPGAGVGGGVMDLLGDLTGGSLGGGAAAAPVRKCGMLLGRGWYLSALVSGHQQSSRGHIWSGRQLCHFVLYSAQADLVACF